MDQRLSQHTPFLVIDRLSKHFLEAEKKRDVLAGISVSIPKGEFTAILGKSGSGKTTLLNLISGIDQPSEGNIHLDGLALTELNDFDRTIFRRRNIGFVFQFFNLIPTLTVWENVMLPLELNGLAGNQGKLKATELLQFVGLQDRKNSFPDLLSGGEQQRVAIARALVHNPQLVLADEPTGNLDAERGNQILQLLDQLTRAAGKNLILVTHSQQAAGYADSVYELRAGKLQVRS